MTAEKKDKRSKLLDQLVGDVHQAFLDDRTILSFREYFDAVLELPDRHLRSSAQYIVDMLDHYGREELDLPIAQLRRRKTSRAAPLQRAGYRSLCLSVAARGRLPSPS